jgi:two-component system sensor histidine kinase/response regulator
VDGLDAALGVRLALGRDALYRSLLTKFVAGQADAPARIAAALAAAEWTSAERHAHTLKGVAAQIGAGEIRTLAAALEQAIRDRQPDAARAALQDRLAGALASLIAALRARLPQAAPSTPSATAESDLARVRTAADDMARVQSVCRRLAAQLEHDDFGCSHLLADNEALLQAALGADHARIAGLVANYDFAAALACLHQALQARGIAP